MLITGVWQRRASSDLGEIIPTISRNYALNTDSLWPPKGKIPSYKRYLDEMYGTPIDTIWDDISNIGSNAKERMGYNTQKPLALLERIIAASSNPGDVVLDPFCGCATTLEAAHKLDRQWIGIDIAIHAVKRVARIRLQERLGLIEGQDFTVEAYQAPWKALMTYGGETNTTSRSGQWSRQRDL